jgi:hypothetical protein
MLTSAFLSNLASLVAVLSPCDWPSVRRTITSRTYYRSPRWLLKICKNRESYNSYGVDKIIQLIQLRLFFQSRNPWPLRAFYTMSLHTICIYLFIYLYSNWYSIYIICIVIDTSDTPQLRLLHPTSCFNLFISKKVIYNLQVLVNFTYCISYFIRLSNPIQ